MSKKLLTERGYATIKVKNNECVLSSFILPRGQKRRLTNAQNEETEPANQTTSRRRPQKCKLNRGREQSKQ
jgi:hypothetical protein